ncbi:hypothetical protein HS125_08760 [bacterium]|nr:hypothetical protein [bacterium]
MQRPRLGPITLHALILCFGLIPPPAARAEAARYDPLEVQRCIVAQAAPTSATEAPETFDAEAMLQAVSARAAQAATGETSDEEEWQSLSPEPHRRYTGPRTGLVTNVFYETDLRSALSDVSQQTGRIIVPDMSVQGLVSAELSDVTLELALDILLTPGGFIYRQMDGFILVTSPAPDSPSFRNISQVRLVRLNYVDAKAAISLFSESMQKYLKADSTSKMVLVTAPPEILDEIAAVLADMDRPPRQVLMDVLVVILEEGKLASMGLQWDFPQAAAGIFSEDRQHGTGRREGAQWPWGVQVGYTTGREFTNSLVATLNLLAQNDEATVLASPQVVAQEGKEAEINVSTEEYFQILTQGFYTNAQLEKIEAGTILRITPQIGDATQITLEMEAEVSDVVARGENNLPVVTRRTARSTIRVEDGGTAAVAGLIDNRSRLGNERVPGLGRVPLVGRAFRNQSHNQVARQVAIFVTPRLLADRAMLGLPAPTREAPPPAGPEFRSQLQESLKKHKGGRTP